ncbi:ergothioneine biosynthesis protein EgtB [Woodsholea maritima]|uniref:ergothioneine biosynthesis protein EgtB n=1 Tax=Woodsholea maritima TaxID=240237 RepID=UPI000378B9F1|nr:ergothioneine biosynthesis protein EgtB [Woodsholea maritima]
MHPALAMRPDLNDRALLKARFSRIRAQTEGLTQGLAPEDMQVQTMDDVSPMKWHLAHTSWFFEAFLLQPLIKGYQPFDPVFDYLFNSYYEAVGERWSRARRGLLTRPLVDEVLRYRAYVTAQVERAIETMDEALWHQGAPIIELGLNHEQQHQELACSDIKHVLAVSPLPHGPYPRPEELPHKSEALGEMAFMAFEGGLVEVGAVAGSGFVYDNELPRHTVYLYPFELAQRPVSNGEWLNFMADGGYQRAEFWLSEGWAMVQGERLQAPLYWRQIAGEWHEYTLHGPQKLDPDQPVCHISGYEAAAYANWAGARLPLEAELELLAHCAPPEGRLLFNQPGVHPARMQAGDGLQAVYGGVWEWTQSAYSAYPGYHPPKGAVGEYNGKFMASQWVLRGGSCATPYDHVRASYRNFFPPSARWQFSGLRLARDLSA